VPYAHLKFSGEFGMTQHQKTMGRMRLLVTERSLTQERLPSCVVKSPCSKQGDDTADLRSFVNKGLNFTYLNSSRLWRNPEDEEEMGGEG
jgi:hypothetical protein